MRRRMEGALRRYVGQAYTRPAPFPWGWVSLPYSTLTSDLLYSPHMEESPGQLHSCSFNAPTAKITPSCSRSAGGQGTSPTPHSSLQREGQPTQASIGCLKILLPSLSVAAVARKETQIPLDPHTTGKHIGIAAEVAAIPGHPGFTWEGVRMRGAWRWGCQGSPHLWGSQGIAKQAPFSPNATSGRDSWWDLGTITRNKSETKEAGTGGQQCQTDVESPVAL